MDRILVVDDEQAVGEILRLYLEREGFAVTVVHDGEAALEAVRRHPFDLVLLDLMLPKKDGWTVCREIRSFSSIPIIMLTARGEEVDRILGLELGADDYVPKPFSPREVVARVKAVLRRSKAQNTEKHRMVDLGPLHIDYEARKVLVHGTPVNLTPKEFELLYFLALHPERVFTREKLLEEIWGYDFPGDTRTVDTHIKRIREKLEEVGAPPLIKTVWGFGYKLDPSAS
ncbi:MAG: response regulator transcription factor [Candidatus Caldatribacterium sp.]|uniref:response regulator transcription factor n=1 Tax=Candidatus Caldatribacterium sp. TaxID=2282143 RepID=UPI0029942255|nr:response regulator transcription factor [Candidatus Caldatribacterium sp.]MCX7731522.1 response regulator transcription factor [Candidatus Caldatribacterium sp.]MDW8081043.1 response regulator transcription factor [Candidatus Calescibacterium sp.]